MRQRAGLESYASWVALAVAFSPVLFDLARNALETPEHRVTLLAPLLLLLAVRSDAEGARRAARHRDGALAIAAGIALQLIGIAGASVSLARLGLPIAALGLARWTGRPRLVAVALLFLAIPVPDTLVMLGSPTLELGMAKAASATLQAFGVNVQVVGPNLVTPAHRIILDPTDGGVILAVALAALGWYSAVREQLGFARAAGRAALLSPIALPLQWIAMIATGLLLAAGMPEAGKLWLRQGAWIAVALCGLVLLHARRPLVPWAGTARIPSEF